MRSLTVARSAPPASSQEACACRRSCGRTCCLSLAAASAGSQIARRNHARGMGPSRSFGDVWTARNLSVRRRTLGM